MDGKMLARLGAIIFVAVAVTATAIEMTRKEEASAPKPVSLQQSARDPLREEQRRCQQLGQKAAEDSECLRVWAETRERFIGRAPAPSSPTQIEGR
jgi:conjugative transfer region protein TrbK